MFVAPAITCAKQSNKEAKVYILVVPVFPVEPNQWIVSFPLGGELLNKQCDNDESVVDPWT